ncbi:peptidase S8 [Flavobacteriaceae bacterium LYZ1037]|nr:peptidase S8 [Flavobacteriaceae bacterium LYZ1037]
MKKTLSFLMMCFLFSGALFAQDLEKSSKILKSKSDQNGKPTFVVFKKDNTYSLQNSNQIFQDILTTDSRNSFQLLESTNDKLGMNHQKFQQYFEGIKVEFATYTLHGENGKLSSMSGEFYDVKETKAPTLSKEQGLNRAMQHLNASSYLWEDAAASKELGYEKPEGELVLLPMFDAAPNAKSEDKMKLAYKYEIFTIVPLGGADVYVDANTGKVLFYNNRVKHYDNFGHDGRKAITSKKAPFVGPLEEAQETAFVAGTAATRYSGSQTIETTNTGSNYTLNDASRKVYTRNANNLAPVGNSLPYITNYSEFSDNDNNWTAAEYNNNDKDNAALDAHWGAMKTYDYWDQVHGRSSYDNNGAQLRSYVHVDNNYDNAFWFLNVMSYGDGSSNGNEGNGYFDALTSIDVAAHEIGHAVTEYTANLAYQRESGGMNEGFSDIWGAAIEHFAKGNGNDAAPSSDIWQIGDEIDRRSGSAALRSMSNPKSLGQPDTYGGTYWQNPNCGTPTNNNDYCGVHTNSGVLNHWFYLLTAGGSGTNDVNDSYNVSGIGISKASNIAYRLVSVYLSANSTYANARTYGIQAATDLYGAGSQEVISTTNAFYAVGVGSEYVQTCSLAAPSNLAGSSINDNGFTLSWNSVSGAGSYTVTVNGSSNNTSGTSYVVTGLNPGTTYSSSVVANCSSGGSGTSSSTSVTTTGTAPLNYCASNGNNVSDEYIGRVQLGTINNTTGASSGGYADYTSISTNLTKGNSATITITPTWTGTLYNEGYSVWIDYNKDGDFSDSGEQVWTKSASKTTPVSGAFTVPTNAVSGATRMRVSMKYNGIPTSCESFSYGEVEDYTVNLVTGAPDTTAPVITLTGASNINLEVGDTYNELGATATDNIDGNLTSSIVITGTVNTASAGTYTRYYNVSDAAGNAATQRTRTVNVTVPADTTAPVIALNGASTINLEVGDTYNELGATATDNVDGNLTSSIVITGTVNTASAGTYTRNYNVSDAAGNAATQRTRTIIVTQPSTGGCSGGISSFPYSQGFENTLGSWSQSTSDNFNWALRSGSTPSSNTGPSSASAGSYYVYMESSSPNYSTKRAILNSPCFDLSAATQATFEFKYHMYGASSMGSLALEVSDDNGSSWTSVWSKSGNQGNSWQTASVNLASYIGGSVQLRLNGVTGTTWQGDMAVDAVSLSTGGGTNPTCSNVTLSITFDNYPEETAWSLRNSSGTTVASGGTYGSQADGSTLNINVGCLDDGCYDFVITDTYGDGICCSYGNGSYTLTNADSGATLASGGSFTSSQTTNFCLGGSGVYQGITSSTISENPNQRFKVYPNPVNQLLNIELLGFEAQSFEVKNMLGQTVLKGRYTSTIDVSKFEAGVYMLQLNIGEKTKVTRFIKK